jgi:hypothetical protein
MIADVGRMKSTRLRVLVRAARRLGCWALPRSGVRCFSGGRACPVEWWPLKYRERVLCRPSHRLAAAPRVECRSLTIRGGLFRAWTGRGRPGRDCDLEVSGNGHLKTLERETEGVRRPSDVRQHLGSIGDRGENA